MVGHGFSDLPIDVLGCALLWKRATSQGQVKIRKMDDDEFSLYSKASVDDFSRPRTMAEIAESEAIAYKAMRAQDRKARTARSKKFNAVLREHGIDPDKFRSLTKKSHGLSAEEFRERMEDECRLGE